MFIHNTKIKGCFETKLDCHNDDRGFLIELFNAGRFAHLEPYQINWTSSRKNAIRGLHIAPYPKLVTCIKGRVFDVCVDARPNSETYLQYVNCVLSEEQQNQFYIPENCAHGFMSLEDDTIVVYCQGAEWNPPNESTIHFQDPKIGIQWPEANEYIVSDKDKRANFLT